MAISPATIAKAAEALNRHPSLSPAARRLGLELLNRTDKRTGKAWPSEARMADALGYDARTIRRAKAELKAKGLLTWQLRGTRTPVYVLAWEALKAIAARLTARLKAAFTPKSSPPLSTPRVSKTAENRPQHSQGRTFLPAYLPQNLNFSSGGGYWKRPGTPAGQILTDQQLNSKAHSRLWAAIRSLAPSHIAQIVGNITEAVEAEAVKAERFTPDNGRTGLRTLATLVGQQVTA